MGKKVIYLSQTLVCTKTYCSPKGETLNSVFYFIRVIHNPLFKWIHFISNKYLLILQLSSIVVSSGKIYI